VRARLGSVEVDAAADYGVRNSQSEGIGRVTVVGDLVCWNNLGRNVVFADKRFRPLGIFGSTFFPGEDEPSQYDLDVHAILDVPELGSVAVLNHYGTIRCFRKDDLLGRHRLRGAHQVEPTVLWSFAADVERTVIASGRLVASRPRSEGAEGLLVSAPLRSIGADACVPVQPCAEDFGEVTALGVIPSSDPPLIAIGGDGRLALAPLVGDVLAPTHWAVDVAFRVAFIALHRDAVWAAGPERSVVVDDYDWELLGGGRYAVLDRSNGALVVGGSLPEDVAWGTGGVAVAPFGPLLAAAGRTGCLHLIDPRRRHDRASTTPPLAESSLGIAHAAAMGKQVLLGFNRGGYRLHALGQSTAGGKGRVE